MISKLFDGWIAYAVAAAVVAGVLGYTYHLGHSAASGKWAAKYAQREIEITEAHKAEISRMAQANAMAKEIEAKRVAELEAESAALEQKIKELSDEADADPDRDRVCLSDGSGMRIDQIH